MSWLAFVLRSQVMDVSQRYYSSVPAVFSGFWGAAREKVATSAFPRLQGLVPATRCFSAYLQGCFGGLLVGLQYFPCDSSRIFMGSLKDAGDSFRV